MENTEKVIEKKVDYFLRYSADIPADEAEKHDPFNAICHCQPRVSFDPKNGWHKIIHKKIKK